MSAAAFGVLPVAYLHVLLDRAPPSEKVTPYLTEETHWPDHPGRRYFEIPRVDMIVRPADGSKLRALRFNSSADLFRRLDEMGVDGASVVYFTQDGRTMERRSVGALNAFLSAGRGLKFWRRMNGGVDRWAWRNFVEHLGLKFRE